MSGMNTVLAKPAQSVKATIPPLALAAPNRRETTANAISVRTQVEEPGADRERHSARRYWPLSIRQYQRAGDVFEQFRASPSAVAGNCQLTSVY
jgi:hypothetical protein